MSDDSASQVLALQLTRQGGERLKELVAGAPMARLAGLESVAEDFERKAVQQQPEVLLVEYDTQNSGLADLLERLRRSVPRAAVVAWSASREPEAILKAMRLGVREYLVDPGAAQEFNDAVLRLARLTQVSGQPAGRIIAVTGVKGGVGGSHLAVNLAWALSQGLGLRVALMDLDLGGGDLAMLLDLSPTRDLTDVAGEFNRLDAVLMDSLMTEVAPGLRLLAAPGDPVAAETIGPEHLARALDHLADAHAVVIMDLSSHLDEVSLMALERAHQILMVVEPTVVGLKNARRLQALHERLGIASAKVSLVVNRDGARGCLERADVARILGREVLAFLPNDSEVILEAGNAGRPVLREWPRARWSKAVRALAKAMNNGQGGAS
ncbi:MAG: P-loop NTPase [Desulfarculus sp.]|nr:P-loop NTPase [Desulfarculus sp.]